MVCGMQVDPAKAAGTSQYDSKTYYFCSKSCKTKFEPILPSTPNEAISCGVSGHFRRDAAERAAL